MLSVVWLQGSSVGAKHELVLQPINQPDEELRLVLLTLPALIHGFCFLLEEQLDCWSFFKGGRFNLITYSMVF